MAKKILIIEDEEIILNLLVKKLIDSGYNVLAAKDGEEGIKKMKEERPDLILLDIIMPKIGGIEVLEKINEEPDLREIPVIVISNSGQPVEIDRARKLGAKDWLVKTEFDPVEVVKKVKKQLQE